MSVAFCKLISPISCSTFTDLSNDSIMNSLEIVTQSIQTTHELYLFINKMFPSLSDISDKSNNIIFDVENSYYNEDYILQSIILNDNDDQRIVVKRKIPDDKFTYTFLEYNHDNPDFDFSYMDVTNTDLSLLFRKKFIHLGICIGEFDVSELQYIIDYNHDKNNNIGSFIYSNNEQKEHHDNILFLNALSIANADNTEDTENKLNAILDNDKNIQFIYTYKKSNVCALGCIIPVIGHFKNNIASSLFGEDIWGECYLMLDDNINSDNTIIDLSKTLFDKIIYYQQHSDKLVRKNPHFFNIYRELS